MRTRGLAILLAAMALVAVLAAPASAANSLWTQAQDLSAEQNDGQAPQVAIADDGSALAVWRFNDPATNKERVQFAARRRGENFVVPGPRQPGETEAQHIARVEPTYLSDPAHEPTPNIRLKMNKAGDAIVVWEVADGSVRSAYKPAGGVFGAEQVVQSQFSAAPDVGIDGQGNATVIMRGTGTRSGSVYRSMSRPAGVASTWGDEQTLVAHPSGFGTNEIPTSYVEVRGTLAVDEEGNRSAVFSSDADPTFDPAHPPSDDSQKVFEVTSGPGATNWTIQNQEYSGNTQPYSTHALRTSTQHLAGWDWGSQLDAVSSPGNPTGVADNTSDPAPGPTSTSGSAFAIDSTGLALWSTGSLLHASYVQNDINSNPDPDTDPVADNAGATRTRPRLAKDAHGSILTVFKQTRGNNESIQVALRPPPAGGGTKFDAPVTVRGANGTERSGAPVALSEPCDLTGAVNCDLEPDAGKADPGPSIAMNSGGEAVAAWAQGDSGGGNLVVKVSLYVPREIPPPPPPPARPKPAVPSLIVLARPLKRGEAAVLTLQSGGSGGGASTRADGGPSTSSEGATKLDWGFGTKNEPPVTGDMANGALERSVRLRLPDRSFKATVEAQTPDGLRTFTRTFTAPNLPSTGDAGKVVDELQRIKTPPVFAVGATDTLTTASKDCSPMKVWTGQQKISGCFKPVENLVDIPGPERGAVHELADQLNLDETKKALMEKATGLTDSYVGKGTALLNDQFPVIPKNASDIVSLPQAKSLISAKAELPVGSASFDPKHGFNLKVDPKKVKIPLGKLPHPPKLPSLGGLEIVGDWNVDLDKQEATIKASIKLPKEITKAGVRFDNSIELRATPERVIIDKASLGPIDVDIGALKVRDFKISYDRAADEWNGQAKACAIVAACISMAPPDGHITLKHGKVTFAGASVRFPPPGIQLFPGIDLSKIGFGVGLDPTRLTGTAEISALRLIGIDGHLVMAFPSTATPFILRADEVGPDFGKNLYGQTYTRPTFGLAGGAFFQIPETDERLEFANGYMLYEYPGYIALGGGGHVDIVGIIQFDGTFAAEADIPTKRFNVHGDVSACVFESSDLCGRAVANISHGPNKEGGAGGCISIGPFSIGGGVQWARVSDPFIWPLDGCKWSRFFIDVKPSSAHASAASAATMTVHQGDPNPVLKLYGQGGAPLLRVRGPGGQQLDGTSARRLDLSPGGKIRILRFDGTKLTGPFTVVGLENAQPGTYTVDALPGSPPIIGRAHASDLPDAKVSGKVTGTDRHRVLRYRVLDRPAQKVTFQEVDSGGATKTIGTTTRGGRGRIRFDSAPGRGVRRIFAQFELSSIPAERKLVTTFKPASPILHKPLRLRLRRRGSSLRVAWRKVSGATSYEVAVRLSSRRSVFARTRRRNVTIKGVPRWLGGRVTVRALDSLRQSKASTSRPFKRIGTQPSPFRELLHCVYRRALIRCGGRFGSGTACLPATAEVSGVGIGPFRLGASFRTLFGRYSARSHSHGATSFCVLGGGRFVVVPRKGKVAFMATTAPGHSTQRLGPGDQLSGPPRGAKRILGGVLVGHRRDPGRVIYGVRGNRVRFLAVGLRQEALSPRLLSRRVRSLGLFHR